MACLSRATSLAVDLLKTLVYQGVFSMKPSVFVMGLISLGSLAALFLTGCQGGGPAGTNGEPVQASVVQVDKDTAGIFGGEFIEESDKLSRSVVAVVYLDEKGEEHLCSGALLTPQVVITSAHCLAPVDRMKVYFSLDMRNPGSVHPARIRQVIYSEKHKKYDENKAAGVKPNVYDFALLKMDSPAPVGTKHFRIFEEPFAIEANPKIGYAGYGFESLSRASNATTGDNRLRHVVVTRTKGPTDETFRVDQTQGRGICVGDSGGAAYLPSQLGLVLVGIGYRVWSPSDQDDICKGTAEFINISTHAKWIAFRVLYMSQSSNL